MQNFKEKLTRGSTASFGLSYFGENEIVKLTVYALNICIFFQPQIYSI